MYDGLGFLLWEASTRKSHHLHSTTSTVSNTLPHTYSLPQHPLRLQELQQPLMQGMSRHRLGQKPKVAGTKAIDPLSVAKWLWMTW